MTFPSIRIEGSILSADILEAIASGDKEFGQKARDFDLEPTAKVKDEIADAWASARAFWSAFQTRMERLREGETGTTETRNQWIVPLLGVLGYSAELARRSEEVQGKNYAISHRDVSRDGLPIHVMGWNDSLDQKRTDSGPRLSPHALAQEYLNLTEHLYAVVTNGRVLRVLRDSSRLIKLSFLEFDLERMFAEELYADFAIFYRLAHASRMPADQDSCSESLIERYHQDAIDSGSRIRDGLSTAVVGAMESLANGFLKHPKNQEIREAVEAEELEARSLNEHLLRLIYRFLFLMVLEERRLVHAPGTVLKKQNLYYDHYSIGRLRSLSEHRHLLDARYSDLWHGIRQTLRLFEDSDFGRALEIPSLGSELFRSEGIELLLKMQLDNASLLSAVLSLSQFEHPTTHVRMRVNYAALDVEELGSVYESLLALHPRFVESEQLRFTYGLGAGSVRKSTGSYYTPDSLVQELVKSALVPVLEERLSKAKSREDKEEAILSMKVCDPAVGSGHFLIAAAHRLAQKLAEVRGREETLSPAVQRSALRDVVGHCLYGVDINPLAVELCKLSLWMLGLEPGKPLSFIDHHIKVGNSLLGTTLDVVEKGIPDAAFKSIEGDDKDYCKELKELNRSEMRDRFQGQLFDRDLKPRAKLESISKTITGLDALSDDTAKAIRDKTSAYEKVMSSADYQRARFLHDAWCAAFVWEKVRSEKLGYPITNNVIFRLQEDIHDCSPSMWAEVKRLAEKYAFFHWHVAFPEVFANGGFDCVLGNPPWEKLQSEEKQWFESREPAIATLTGAERKKAIRNLSDTNPKLHAEWNAQRRLDASSSHLVKTSGIYPLTGVGKFNSFGLFAELNKNLVSTEGRFGCVLPTGIATDDTTKLYFQSLVASSTLVSLFDFVNKKGIFPTVHRQFKFCLLTGTGVGHRVVEADFAFFAETVDDLSENTKRFTLSPRDIARLNPNSLTCPIFRFRRDADLTLAIYRHIPVLVCDADEATNPWSVTLRRMFNLTDDSKFFVTEDGLSGNGWVKEGSHWVNNGQRNLPLYEAKYIHHFDHRWEGDSKHPDSCVAPRYYIDERQVVEKIGGLTDRHWFVGWRDITNVTNERTVISSIVPWSGVGNTIYLFYADSVDATTISVLPALLSSCVVDYCARQKVGGTHLNHSYMKQLPVLPPKALEAQFGASDSHTLKRCIINRVLELTYTAWDLKDYAHDNGYDGPPFLWDEERRFQLRCELDALFMNLYLPCNADGRWTNFDDETVSALERHFETARDAVEYIMETFPILKRRDEESYGSYKSKERILETYDNMLRARQTGSTWRSPLNPPPGPPTDAEGKFIPFSEWENKIPSHIHPAKS